MSAPGPVRVGPLAVVAGVATLLAATGALPRWPGLTHVVALPPLDLLTDLQLLLVYSTGWPSFLLGMGAVVGARTVLLAWMLGGPTRERLGFALRFELAVLVPTFLAAALLYAAKAVLFYLLFWLGFIVALLLLLAAAWPWVGALRLRTAIVDVARRGFRLGTIGAYLAGLTVVGGIAGVAGPWGSVAMIPVSAALTMATVRMLANDSGWRWVRRGVALAPAVGLVALGVVWTTGPAAPPEAAAPDPERPGSVLLMSGIDSSSGSGAILEIDPASLGWSCDRARFHSYAGPGDGQPQGDARCPIGHGAPYGPEDTLRPREEQVSFLEAQAAELDPPGLVAGHSQGAWLVWDAASRDRLPNVSGIVLVGAFPENPVAYPAANDRAPGRVGRHLLTTLQATPRPGGTTVFEPDSPLGRDWLGARGAVEATLARPLPDGMAALSVTSMFDLPLMHWQHRVDGAVDACPVPVIHPNLPYAEEFHSAVNRFLDGDPQPACPWWRRAVGPALRHFTAPPS